MTDRLIAELLSKFINLPSGQVVDEVRHSLRRLGEELQVDRCSFWRTQPDGVAIVPITWQSEGVGANPPLHTPNEQFPWAFETLSAGRLLCFSSLQEVPNPVDRANYKALGIRSSVTFPLMREGKLTAALGFNMLRSEREWSPEFLRSIRLVATVFEGILTRVGSDEVLRSALEEAERLRDQLHTENTYLRRLVKERDSQSLIGRSQTFQRMLVQLRQVAATDSTVLLLGETGTGKELLASQVHELSIRRTRVMVRVNCASIPAALIESELFGRERGAYTGALARQIGRFELADRSTIFLDEIGELPAEVQVKLLRVLEERQIERLGSPKPIYVDVRIIAATHRNLEQKIVDGSFREDLFYRLNVFPVRVPPLRERIDDIPLLVWHFVDEFSKAFHKTIDVIPRENMAALSATAGRATSGRCAIWLKGR